MTRRRVVITGLGIVSPLGLTTQSTWEACKAGRSGVARVTRFDVSDYPAQIAAEVKGFNPLDFLEVKEVKKHDLFSQYSIAAATEAWSDAQLNDTTFDQTKFGCIL